MTDSTASGVGLQHIHRHFTGLVELLLVLLHVQWGETWFNWLVQIWWYWSLWLHFYTSQIPWISLFLLLVFRELKHGIPITDENDNRLGESSKAAQQAISQVVVSRILMAAPGMGMDVMLLCQGSHCYRYARKHTLIIFNVSLQQFHHF